MNRTLFFKDEDACSTPEIGHALKADDAISDTLKIYEVHSTPKIGHALEADDALKILKVWGD